MLREPLTVLVIFTVLLSSTKADNEEVTGVRRDRQHKLTRMAEKDGINACVYLVLNEDKVLVNPNKPNGAKAIKQAFIGVAFKSDSVHIKDVTEDELNAVEGARWYDDWDRLTRAFHRVGQKDPSCVSAIYLGEHSVRKTDNKRVYRAAFIKKAAADRVEFDNDEVGGVDDADFQDKIVKVSKRYNADPTYLVGIPICEYGKRNNKKVSAFIIIKRNAADLVEYALGQ
jgi:hypothetical protein